MLTPIHKSKHRVEPDPVQLLGGMDRNLMDCHVQVAGGMRTRASCIRSGSILLTLWLGPAHAQNAHCPSEWVDIDTPAAACSSTSQRDGTPLKLVFSDEFEQDGRTFYDGEDARWTALESAPYSNEQVNYYNASKARTRGGKLEILCTNEDVTVASELNGSTVRETRHYQSAMIQTWNKFCLREGAVELSARMPGEARQPGLWPAFWLMGNLGRATFAASTDGMWPWSYDDCPASGDAWTETQACAQTMCARQRISACNPSPGHGLHPYQGRGAPEIDVLETLPGSGPVIYYGPVNGSSGGGSSNCPIVAADALAAATQTRPLVSSSLIFAPGIAHQADERPTRGCLPSPGQWYANFTHFGGAPFGDGITPLEAGLTVTLNFDFYGDDFDRYYGGTLQTDGISGNTALHETHFSAQHVYRCEWRNGPGGFIRWSIDGALQYEIMYETLARRFPYHVNGTRAGEVGPRMLPTEPMYLIVRARQIELVPHVHAPRRVPSSSRIAACW